MITLTGKKVSEGIAIGKIRFYKRDNKDIKRFYVKDVEKEVSRFQKARKRAVQELQGLYENAAKEVGEANAAIFEMQQMILEDEDFVGRSNSIIASKKLNAEYAVQKVAQEFIDGKVADAKDYMIGHDSDVRDVTTRVCRILSRGRIDRMLIGEPFVLAAGELYPSEAMNLDASQVLAFVTRYGTINSHTAVLARTKGIPSVIGLGEALKDDYEGKTIIVDGYEGKVYIEPDYTTITKMKERQNRQKTQVMNLERLKGKDNVTQSGRKIDVCTNINSREDIDKALRCDAGGIGLFRSEFLYMENGKKPPTEEQQFQVFKLAAEAMGRKKVVIRTADLGGDKTAECFDFGEDPNPAMGLRGIRFFMEKDEVFKTHLRAILRASAFGNIKILLPMINSLEEVKFAKIMLERAKNELKYEKTLFNPNIELGVMIETPAAVMISGDLAREVDFFCIGTNDLTQFTLGVDRTSPRVEKHYNTTHPAVLKMIRIVNNNIHMENKTVSICGDLAADHEMTEFFIQIGIDELSVAPNEVLPLRKRIREIQ